MTTLRSILSASALFAALALLAAPASAQEQRPERPCREDVQRLCADAEGHEQVRQCLAEHRADLSDACLNHVEEAEERRANVINACQDDAARLCQGLTPGRELMACMREHRDEVSDTCREAVKAAHKDRPHGKKGKGKGHAKGERGGKAREAIRAACGQDIQAACGDIEPGSGELRQCIKAHRDEFSASCQETLAEVHKHKKGKKGRRGAQPSNPG